MISRAISKDTGCHHLFDRAVLDGFEFIGIQLPA
jgi:hypothetical protein